ncbi:hypothetical protein [Natrinema halophilum]|uniref:Uncharacterized protein n=1 Tax=Natrinema halophilum TaxID=1699371 RepID=A0A7D5KK53_9EURY|nr:hypothetical protein [Natrinema halophilum]QLG48738.1 hypothetical protein HYG82_07700 [Natrinema halophilum]
MILSGSGLGSAADSPWGDSSGGISVEDGKFVLGATPDEISQETYRLSKTAVSNFNAVIEAGYFSINSPTTNRRLTTQQIEKTTLTPSEGATVADIAAADGVEPQEASVSLGRTQEREDSSRITLAAQSCNKNNVDTSRQALPPKVDFHIYKSHDFITDINHAVAYGSPSGALIYKYLVRRGYIAAGALAGPVATAVFAGVAAYWGVVNIQNDGCGVIIKTGVSPIDPLVPTPTVNSQ